MNYINAIDDAIGKPERILPAVLNGYKPIDGDFTLYQKYAGGYCVVYPLSCPGKPNKCIRIWHEKYDKELVQKLADLLTDFPGADFVIGYKYYEDGLKLDNGEVIPVVVMDWIEGSTLNDYIKENCKDSTAIKRLANEFYTMTSIMHREGLAHGDLSCDNIMVKRNGKLVLIDYDSFYAPSLSSDIKQTNKGTPGYQHPERLKSLYLSSDMDNFSQQVIYLSLIAIAQDLSLVSESRGLVADKKLFFNFKDFSDDSSFVASDGYKAMAAIDNSEVKNRLAELRCAVNSKLADVKSIVEFSSQDDSRNAQEERNKKLREKLIIKRDTERNKASVNTSVGTKKPSVMHSAQTGTPWYRKWYVWACAAVVVVGLAFAILPSDNEAIAGHATQTELAITTATNRLDGNYTLREMNGGTLVNGIRTAAIKKTSESQARILVTSEFGPEFYDFTLNTNGIVKSEQLGTGEITYNKKLDKITLTFKQGERICEFTK